MIKVSVMYPAHAGATFNMEYYCNSHMPLVERLLRDTLKGIAVDQGVGPDSPYVAMGHLMFDSLEASQSALAAHTPELMQDIPNYTNCRPVIQVSEVKM